MFLDRAKIKIKAGNGGDGAVAFHREKYVAAGGPDGGNGGRGGDVIAVGSEGLNTLVDFRYKRKFQATPGENGSGNKKTGKNGTECIIKVPMGTLIFDSVTGRLLADITPENPTAIIAKGGKGGAGNMNFATSTRQVPQFAKAGEPGESFEVYLELKLIADVGLIGFPSVGKSSILAKVSAAKPKIAEYHFTTLVPNLGVVRIDEEASFVLADIPGLIEGASEGQGLGHEFLRHIERTGLLIHVVDVAGSEGRDPIEDFDAINKELAQYNEALSSRPQVIAANKKDLPGWEDNYEHFKAEMESRGYRVFPISAITGEGLTEMMQQVYALYRSLPKTTPINEYKGEIMYTAEDTERFTVTVEEGVYKVTGKDLQRLVAATNFENYDALQYFQRVLKKMGVIEALENNGISEDDTVNIEGVEFDYKR